VRGVAARNRHRASPSKRICAATEGKLHKPNPIRHNHIAAAASELSSRPAVPQDWFGEPCRSKWVNYNDCWHATTTDLRGVRAEAVAPADRRISERCPSSSITLSNVCGVSQSECHNPSYVGMCRWTRSQLMTYGLVTLFGSTTRKRIASSGLRSSTAASSLSCARLVSTSPTRFWSRCRRTGW
jgi:hypothetical protein